jgi:hypothetical protein
MNIEITTFLAVSGALAALVAMVYSICDMLLMAFEVSLADYPQLQLYTWLLTGAEKMVVVLRRCGND